ncbi:MAG: hypothetical protein WBC70_16550, partial [Candidatus Aminicenantales bacterium]
MKRLKIVFFLFVLFLGAFYVWLIPPWQSPDETHHFGYGVLISGNVELGSEEHAKIDREIMESMAVFHAWKYTNLIQPD